MILCYEYCLDWFILKNHRYFYLTVIPFCRSVINTFFIREIAFDSRIVFCLRSIFRLRIHRLWISAYCSLTECVSYRTLDSVRTVSRTGDYIYICTLRWNNIADQCFCTIQITAVIMILHNLNRRNLSSADHNLNFQSSSESGSCSIIGSIFICCRILYVSQWQCTSLCRCISGLGFSRLSTVFFSCQCILHCTDNTIRAKCCARHHIHIQSLPCNDPVYHCFCTVKECCIVRRT